MRRLALLLALLSATASAQVPESAWQYRRDMVQSAWRIHGPGAPIATLAAQIHQESGWNCNAVSWAGAKGCSQFMDGTADDAGTRWPADCYPVNPFSPRWAFACRDRYLRSLSIDSRAQSLTECDTWAFKLRAYNGGLGWIRKDRTLAQQSGADPDDWQAVTPFNSGRRLSAWRENTEYPARIYALESRYAEWGRELGCLSTHEGERP